ncbi:hypothetical protein KDH_01960 [Dictyobacter sp. S3.2.2.5]|uniref:Response regulatory domain-containing protein n=1 Tax=Dictyobacter halimunensis TaxID=3026934 RepID=A0ABQ6FID3_9CHLR|nr:hypothetical protein KDH_01960 [Dictyobacter sp. S3.2.2.5]
MIDFDSGGSNGQRAARVRREMDERRDSTTIVVVVSDVVAIGALRALSEHWAAGAGGYVAGQL